MPPNACPRYASREDLTRIQDVVGVEGGPDPAHQLDLGLVQRQREVSAARTAPGAMEKVKGTFVKLLGTSAPVHYQDMAAHEIGGLGWFPIL
jgi:hypothetical protein